MIWFGTRVHVAYSAGRVTAYTDRTGNIRCYHDGIARLPGLPLDPPSADLAPARDAGDRVWRLLRRFPCDSPGTVVGYTFRLEGERVVERVIFDGDPEPRLHESRREKVYQVALAPPAALQGTHLPWPAQVVDVLPGDLEVAR